MILVNVALAAEPVLAVECARAIHFATPYRWTWAADRPSIDDATALVVRADADLLRPRAVGGPVLYVGGWPAEVLWWSGDEALVLAPVAVADTVSAWFGSAQLPERVDAEHRKAETTAAAAITPVSIQSRSASLTWSGSRRALVSVLEGWADTCR